MNTMVEIEKQALIQILSIKTNKKGENRDVIAQYDHICVTYEKFRSRM